MKLTNSLEEYLKTIYIIAIAEKRVRVTDVAKKLNCTKPSVNRALNALKEDALIKYEAYKNIELTKKGTSIAKNIIKKQDTFKLFLTEVLEVEKEKAEKEAALIKHAISEETVSKLEQYINKILDLGDLECGYDSENETCKRCVKLTAKRRLKKEF